MEKLLVYIGYLIYVVLGVVAVWGAFCVVLVWRRVSQTRFRTEADQDQFLNEIEKQLIEGDFAAAAAHCKGDRRAMPQLALLALSHRDQGFGRIRQLVVDRFQRDVLSDLEYRLSWVYTVIKSAPMIGLLGTVIGMMGAFTELSSGTQVDTTGMARTISFALVTTACGLAIAIPLVLCAASVNVRIRKLEDLVGSGLARFLESLRPVLPAPGGKKEQPHGE